MSTIVKQGQLNDAERAILRSATLSYATAPSILEIGTWLGGGSTYTFLQALSQEQKGFLWGIEADPEIFEKMRHLIANQRDFSSFFEPILGYSQQVIPKLLTSKPDLKFSIAFLDGGNNPNEQIEEFELLHDRIEIGGRIFAHDVKLRKGKWLVPYLSELDNWKVTVHDVSTEGLLEAVKIKSAPSAESLSKAQKILAGCRRDPVEIIGQLLPSNICSLILRMMPRSLARRFAEGRV